MKFWVIKRCECSHKGGKMKTIILFLVLIFLASLISLGIGYIYARCMYQLKIQNDSQNILGGEAMIYKSNEFKNWFLDAFWNTFIAWIIFFIIIVLK